MRKQARCWAVGLMLAAVGSASWTAGCLNSAGDCERTLTCEHYRPGEGGGGGGTPAGCVPSENAEAVGDECGVFVAAAGDDAAAGTKEAPLATLGAAITRAAESGGRVYACAESFTETVEVPGGVTLYGGLECANGWRWIGEMTKTMITAGEGEVPLRLRGGTGAARVEDVEVVAASIDATANPMLRGTSSIAAIAEGIAVELVRSMLVAGDAAPGVDGAVHPMPAMAGADGNPGNEACSDSLVDPGLDKVNDCGTPNDPIDDSSGGPGGIGLMNSGGNGSDGLPLSTANGGTGESAAVCTPGNPGTDGATGEPGTGAMGLGTISAAGYVGVSGSEGMKGAPGQGGGGGGGAKGGSGAGRCPDPMSAGGASGGSGASGGCGGAGGRGGGPGGSSIALISLGATLSFDSVTLRAGLGGTGGAGGLGQNGGAGGQLGGAGGAVPGGSNLLNAGCTGGRGGAGGPGGRGGGGLGGHSLGIAYQGSPSPVDGLIVETSDPGLGGAGADPQHEGAPGVKAEVQSMP